MKTRFRDRDFSAQCAHCRETAALQGKATHALAVWTREKDGAARPLSVKDPLFAALSKAVLKGGGHLSAGYRPRGVMRGGASSNYCPGTCALEVSRCPREQTEGGRDRRNALLAALEAGVHDRAALVRAPQLELDVRDLGSAALRALPLRGRMSVLAVLGRDLLDVVLELGAERRGEAHASLVYDVFEDPVWEVGWVSWHWRARLRRRDVLLFSFPQQSQTTRF